MFEINCDDPKKSWKTWIRDKFSNVIDKTSFADLIQMKIALKHHPQKDLKTNKTINGSIVTSIFSFPRKFSERKIQLVRAPKETKCVF